MLAAMTPEPAPQKSSVPSPEEFVAFLDWLSPNREIAAKQYLEIRKKLVQHFIRRGCAHAEELADATVDRAAMIAYRDPAKYSTPQQLCCGISRNIWLEYLHKPWPEPLQPGNIPGFNPDDSGVREHEANCLDNCMERLSSQERDLIVQYHQFRGRKKIELRKRLAEQYGGNLNKLRITACRIRARLSDCISSCMQRASAIS
jgi:DNA-directed RNA polymerase specialized sigma24 family protein